MLRVDVRRSVGALELVCRFRIEPGITVLFGPSGAGKTLTLRLLAGVDRPDTGRIELDGEVFADTAARIFVRPQERRLGMVFQEPFLLPHRSVVDNVALAVRGGDRAARHAQAMRALEAVEAAEWAARRPSTLSGGQAQRVALARALAGAPRLLLLDEPFSALDVLTRRRLRAVLRRVVEQSGVPALFVTHDPDEARELANHLLVAAEGNVTRMCRDAEIAQELGRVAAPLQA